MSLIKSEETGTSILPTLVDGYLYLLLLQSLTTLLILRLGLIIKMTI
jgi:hypothetical protein